MLRTALRPQTSFRLAMVMLFAGVAMAGCFGGGPGDLSAGSDEVDAMGDEGDPWPPEEWVPRDDLTQRFIPGDQIEAYPNEILIGEVQLGTGNRINLTLGDDLECQGTLPSYMMRGYMEETPPSRSFDKDDEGPPAAFEVATFCAARLAKDPAAELVKDVPTAGLFAAGLASGYLTEPIEWRVGLFGITRVDNVTEVETILDSQWRRAPLPDAPHVTISELEVDIEDPCDAPDGVEEVLGFQGNAHVKIQLTTGMNQDGMFVMDVSPSRITGNPEYTGGGITWGSDHVEASLPSSWNETLELSFDVDLEVAEPWDQQPGVGCTGAQLAEVLQTWTLSAEAEAFDGTLLADDAETEVRVFLGLP